MKNIKALLLTLLGMILFLSMIYLSISFLQLSLSPIVWGYENRLYFLFFAILYSVVSPLIFNNIKYTL